MENGIEVAETIAPRARWGIEQAEERREGVRVLRDARAARAGERMENASENERSGRNKDGGDRTPRARAGWREGEREREASIAVRKRKKPEREPGGTTRPCSVPNTRAARVAHGSSGRTHARRR